MERDPWTDDVYDTYYFGLNENYIERRKKVDDLQLDWLDAVTMYASPEVVLLTREEILERSSWTEEEVTLLFADRRFPSTEYARKQVVEVHALIQFFARKDAVRKRQLQDKENREAFFARLRGDMPRRLI